eukprot:gene2119-biopygen11302
MSRGGCSRTESSWNRVPIPRNPDKTMRKGP